MKCSKCGYDYPARETKCPYCGEPNKLGMEWEKEEDETRKENRNRSYRGRFPIINHS